MGNGSTHNGQPVQVDQSVGQRSRPPAPARLLSCHPLDLGLTILPSPPAAQAEFYVSDNSSGAHTNGHSSGNVASAHPSSHSTAASAVNGNAHGSGAAQGALAYEDGSLLFSAGLLGGHSVEDLLTA